MGDSEKPFACPSPGCSMSFINEDHLVVHRKKHDMVLNLGSSGKNTFVADQTPTPTRFIRNCEEVGLFQDLQNVNPFEETFRRAVEAGKTGALSELEAGGMDDTLHTPHIFPNISDQTSSTIVTVVSKRRKDAEIVSIDGKNHSNNSENIVEESKDVETILEMKNPLESSNNNIVVEEADTSIVPKIIATTCTSPNLTINGQEVQLLLKTADGKLMQLSAIPVCENRIASQTVLVQNDESSINCKMEEKKEDKKLSSNDGSSNSRLSLVKMRLKEALTKNASVSSATASNDSPEVAERPKSGKNNEKVTVNVEQRIKQDVLARNRASSMRARAKRKVWIQQLQRTAGNANEKNAALQTEVKALRSEVARLRALLLAHENCPVTRAIERGSLITVESEKGSVLPVVENIRVNQPNVSCRKRCAINGETAIAPKIEKSSMKHQVILPKAEIINDLSMRKIIDVRSLPIEREMCKRIVFVQNPARRVEFVRNMSRSLVQINPPTLQIENAASKCTGT